MFGLFYYYNPGTRLFFHRVPPTVLSPLNDFTTKFEMDWCGSRLASAPKYLNVVQAKNLNKVLNKVQDKDQAN